MSKEQIYYLVDDGTTVMVVDSFDLDRSEMEVLDQGSDYDALDREAEILDAEKRD